MIKTSSNNIVHSKRTILEREATICKVKPCSVFALLDIVSFGVYCQYCVINHTTTTHSQGPLWLIGLQLQKGLCDDLFSRQVDRRPAPTAATTTTTPPRYPGWMAHCSTQLLPALLHPSGQSTRRAHLQDGLQGDKMRGGKGTVESIFPHILKT